MYTNLVGKNTRKNKGFFFNELFFDIWNYWIFITSITRFWFSNLPEKKKIICFNPNVDFHVGKST